MVEQPTGTIDLIDYRRELGATGGVLSCVLFNVEVCGDHRGFINKERIIGWQINR